MEGGDGDEWNIRGKTDLDIRNDKENALLAMESDRRVMETGRGESYTVREENEGKTEYLEIIKRPARDSDGKITGVIALINDVTDEQNLRMQLEEKAMKDELTGIYNRHYFDSYMTELKRMKDGCGLPVSFVSVDCDRLKAVNDTYGHTYGDSYLRMAVFVMRSSFPPGSILFRMGGDEFLAVLPDTDGKAAKACVESLYREAEKHSVREFVLSLSCGISCMTDAGDNIWELVKKADDRMYRVKKKKQKGESKNGKGQ